MAFELRLDSSTLPAGAGIISERHQVLTLRLWKLLASILLSGLFV